MIAGGVERAVAVGGGTGLPRVLTALLSLGYDPTAIVTMADDGGSSGRLREQLGMLPPGDVRNCLVALGSDDLLRSVFQYRFPDGDGLAGHALGNLVIAALADITEDFPGAIQAAGEWLGARGEVLPSTLEDVRLAAVDRAGAPIAGQARIANNPVPIAHVELEPVRPAPYPPVLSAIEGADLVTVGPGSLFTSIVPNLLVGGIPEALCDSGARRVYICNVANQRGETVGFDAADHVDALVEHGLEGAIDVVLVHRDAGAPDEPGLERVRVDEEAIARIEARGMRVVVTDLADSDDPRHHDPAAIARAVAEVA